MATVSSLIWLLWQVYYSCICFSFSHGSSNNEQIHNITRSSSLSITATNGEWSSLRRRQCDGLTDFYDTVGKRQMTTEQWAHSDWLYQLHTIQCGREKGKGNQKRWSPQLLSAANGTAHTAHFYPLTNDSR